MQQLQQGKHVIGTKVETVLQIGGAEYKRTEECQAGMGLDRSLD